MKLSVEGALKRLDADGGVFAPLLQHGSLSVEIYRPRKVDLQQPHTRDEIYVIAAGKSNFTAGNKLHEVVVGDVLFVPAHQEHRFSEFSDDFSTWVFFYGPEGGEG